MFEEFADSLKEKTGGNLPFAGLLESIRGYFRDIQEKRRMGTDILFMITYMASITTASVSRPEIFAFTAERKEYITTRYVKRVECFVKRWNYSYAEGLRMVAERVHNRVLASLFNRYGNSIESGVPDPEFLHLELATTRSVFRNTFDQGIEMLKKWGDAYIALMLSSTIVSIIIMISIAIYSPEDIDGTLRTSYLLVGAISAFGLITMYKAIPDDQKCHNLPDGGTYEQKMIERLERVILPICVVTSVILLLLGVNFGVIVLLVGILLAPLGIFGWIDDNNIINRDEDFTVFIRGLGSIMGGKGLTTTPALADVDRKSLTVLGPFIDAVYSKLNLGLNETLVWQRFIRDTGSNLIYKYLNIFRDSIKLGGHPTEIAKIVSTSMLEQTLLRQKREMLATSFVVLMIPMHIAMIAIFAFLYHIMLTMTNAVKGVMDTFSETASALNTGSSSVGGSMLGSFNILGNFPEDKMATYLCMILMIITISNIFAGKIVKGGARYIYYFFGSILFGLTGIIFIVTPFIVDIFFKIPVFEAI